MNAQEKACCLLQAFATAQGITDLTFDEKGHCALIDGEERVIHLQYDTGMNRLVCITNIGALPPSPQAVPELLYQLLSANFCWMDSLDATLAIEEASNHIVIQQHFSLETADDKQFSAFIEGFIATALHWEERLAAMQADIAEDDTAPEEEEEDTNLAMNAMIKV